MTTPTSVGKIVLYVLAAIGVIALMSCLGMWAMHKSMMGQSEPQAVVAKIVIPPDCTMQITTSLV